MDEGLLQQVRQNYQDGLCQLETSSLQRPMPVQQQVLKILLGCLLHLQAEPLKHSQEGRLIRREESYLSESSIAGEHAKRHGHGHICFSMCLIKTVMSEPAVESGNYYLQIMLSN